MILGIIQSRQKIMVTILFSYFLIFLIFIFLENLNLSGIGNNYNLGNLACHNPTSGLLKFDDGTKLRKEDIRNLSNKIRFSSNEDIKKIDEGY